MADGVLRTPAAPLYFQKDTAGWYFQGYVRILMERGLSRKQIEAQCKDFKFLRIALIAVAAASFLANLILLLSSHT